MLAAEAGFAWLCSHSGLDRQSGEIPGKQPVLSCCEADPKPALARALSVAKATLEVLGGGWREVSQAEGWC